MWPGYPAIIDIKECQIMASRLTRNQREWMHQIQLLQRRQRTLEAKGYSFEDIIPEMPRRITKNKIEGIKRLRGSELKQKAVNYEIQIKIEQEQKRKPKSKIIDIVSDDEIVDYGYELEPPSEPSGMGMDMYDTGEMLVTNFTQFLGDNWPNGTQIGFISEMIERMVQQYGVENIGDVLQEVIANNMSPSQAQAYEGLRALEYVVRIERMMIDQMALRGYNIELPLAHTIYEDTISQWDEPS